MVITSKRQLFVEYYLGEANGNATAAARMAGYTNADMGRRLTRMPEIRALIEARVSAVALTTDEILGLWAEQARGTMADFVSFEDNGEPHIDLVKANERGKLRLIRKLTRKGDGGIEIELYDVQTALIHLGRYYKLYTDKVEVAETGPIEIVYVNDWRDK